MNIDLKWVLIISMALAILGFLSGANAQFADLGLSPMWVKAIGASIGLLLGCGNAINSVFVAFGMTPSNRLASAASVEGVKGIQVDPKIAAVATAAVGADAKITTT